MAPSKRQIQLELETRKAFDVLHLPYSNITVVTSSTSPDYKVVYEYEVEKGNRVEIKTETWGAREFKTKIREKAASYFLENMDIVNERLGGHCRCLPVYIRVALYMMCNDMTDNQISVIRNFFWSDPFYMTVHCDQGFSVLDVVTCYDRWNDRDKPAAYVKWLGDARSYGHAPSHFITGVLQEMGLFPDDPSRICLDMDYDDERTFADDGSDDNILDVEDRVEDTQDREKPDRAQQAKEQDKAKEDKAKEDKAKEDKAKEQDTEKPDTEKPDKVGRSLRDIMDMIEVDLAPQDTESTDASTESNESFERCTKTPVCTNRKGHKGRCKQPKKEPTPKQMKGNKRAVTVVDTTSPARFAKKVKTIDTTANEVKTIDRAIDRTGQPSQPLSQPRPAGLLPGQSYEWNLTISLDTTDSNLVQNAMDVLVAVLGEGSFTSKITATDSDGKTVHVSQEQVKKYNQLRNTPI